MHIVGTQNRSEIELDPAQALRRGTDHREKDLLDKQVLERIKQGLKND